MRFFFRKRKLCDTYVLAGTNDGRVLIEVNKIPDDNSQPHETTEETIREIEIYLAMRRV